MICEVRPAAITAIPGPRTTSPRIFPLVYLPRGLDNSSGAQVTVPDGRFGPLQGQLIHFSYGTGTHFLVLRDKVDGQPQGAAVPLPGDFLSGVHRGRFNPKDGQLYVTGMAGWGTYTPADGCFQRSALHRRAGPASDRASTLTKTACLLTFSRPLRQRRRRARRNAISPRPGTITTARAMARPSYRPGTRASPATTCWRSARHMSWPTGGRLFLEIPDLQPVNQLHLHVTPGRGRADRPVRDDPQAGGALHRHSRATSRRPKTIAAHPILADMVALNHRPRPNPWLRKLPGARAITIEAGKNLSYSVRSFKVRAGEPIKLTFMNPDSVPHNWALIKPGTLARVGDLVNKIIAEPDAASRHYIPRTRRRARLHRHRRAARPDHDLVPRPAAPGRYPYLCTFPGHWMVMNGEMIVE